VKQLARKSALSMKVKSENLKVVENFTFEVPKTTSFINVMAALGLDKKKSLFIVGDYDKNLYLSSRNLQGVKVVNSSEISTYDIMNASEVVLSEGAVEKITAILS
jgi:large subunit ribosomal protein L4